MESKGGPVNLRTLSKVDGAKVLKSLDKEQQRYTQTVRACHSCGGWLERDLTLGTEVCDNRDCIVYGLKFSIPFSEEYQDKLYKADKKKEAEVDKKAATMKITAAIRFDTDKEGV